MVLSKTKIQEGKARNHDIKQQDQQFDSRKNVSGLNKR
jgi:hypothetical protein